VLSGPFSDVTVLEQLESPTTKIASNSTDVKFLKILII
jgi:hypothetical protein